MSNYLETATRMLIMPLFKLLVRDKNTPTLNGGRGRGVDCSVLQRVPFSNIVSIIM